MDLILLVVTLVQLTNRVGAWVAQTIDLHGCQGRRMPMEECSDPDSIMRVESVTIFASPNSTKISTGSCFSVQDCSRIIHGADDVGITDSFEHLYKWIVHMCEGRQRCNRGGHMPHWWFLTGDFKNENSASCPQIGTKYFAAVHAHISCVVNEEVPTQPPPPETTPRPTPTTPATTAPFSTFIQIYQPELIGREKVYLGVAIGLSLAILILILITLYCCERYREKKKLSTLLIKLGAPQAEHTDYLDDLEVYGKPDESWDSHYNPDCIAEYSGVKPDEFVTLDRVTSEYKQFIPGHQTLRSTNSCSTINKNGYNHNIWRIYGQPNGGYDEDHKLADHISIKEPSQAKRKSLLAVAPGVVPLSYDSAENLEMERRMAAELGSPENHSKNERYYRQDYNEIEAVSYYSECSEEHTDSTLASSDVTTDSDSDRVVTGQEDQSDEEAHSNETRELHVIAEENAEDEEVENDETQDNSHHKGLHYKVEVQFDGIGKILSEKSNGKREGNVHSISPTQYRCEIKEL